MMVLSGQGFLPVEGNSEAMAFGASLRRVPLYRGKEQITRNYCLFWKRRTLAITWKHFPIYCAQNLNRISGCMAALALARAAFRIR